MLVVEAVRSLLARTDHEDVEVVVVHDTPTPPAVLDELREVAGDRLVLVPFDRPFNFSEKINVGVCHSSGDRVVFLNDDIEAISQGWLEQLVAPLDEPDVGLTGAKLYFSDQTVQHAGHAYYNAGYHHPFKFWTRDEVGPFGELVVNREVTGVTAACAAMRRETFFEIGGFTEALPGNFNDVDLCYKVAGGRPADPVHRHQRALPLRVAHPRGARAGVGAARRRRALGRARRGPLHPAARSRCPTCAACRSCPRTCSTDVRARSG